MKRPDATAPTAASHARRGRARPALHVLLSATVLCLINAAKPLTIDDPAHYAYGLHIAEHPLDPHGFSFFWYQHPLPAHEILAPPVFDYWLALGFRLFGDRPFAVKLWLLPWCVLLAAALTTLLRRFARPLATPLLWMTLLSPAVLPLLNLMIDIPCLALHLSAVACFLAARERGSWTGSVVAGLLAGLAMQTKYTALTLPIVLLATAIVAPQDRRRASKLGFVAVVVAVAVFASWEGFTRWRYGESHFLHHLSDGDMPWQNKLNFLGPLVALIGGVGPAVGLLGLLAWRFSARTVFVGMAWSAAGLLVLAYASDPPRDDAARLFAFGGPGFVTVAVLSATATRFARRPAAGVGRAADRFLAAWWLIEVAGALAISPWPAARRVTLLLVVGTLLLGRLAALTVRSSDRRRLVGLVAAFGIALGLLFEAIDIDNAAAERTAVERTTTWIRDHDPTGPIYFTGHWGLQFYAERAGWRPVDPDHTRLPRDSWLVMPFRDLGCQRLDGPAETRLAHRVAADSRWPIATLPWLHAANTPLRRQVGPVVMLSIYRVTSDCTPRTPADGGMRGP